MPHITPNQTEDTKPEPPRESSRESSTPNAPAAGPDIAAPKRGEKGALFRALIKAGCDERAAYNADAEVGSMAAQNVVSQLGAQMQLGFMELKQICKENAERLAEQGQRLAEHGQKLEALAAAGAERDRKLDVLAAEVTGLKEVVASEVTGLKEVLAARTDALKIELRLVWGALGILVTVLLAVFGFLFTR